MVSLRNTLFIVMFCFIFATLLIFSIMTNVILDKKTNDLTQQDMLKVAKVVKYVYNERLAFLLNSGKLLSTNISQIRNFASQNGLEIAQIIDKNGMIKEDMATNRTGFKTTIDLAYFALEYNWPIASTEILKPEELSKDYSIRRIPTLYQHEKNLEYESNVMAMLAVVPIDGNFLVLGDVINKDSKITDKIKNLIDYDVSIYMDDMVVSTSKTTKKGNMYIGTVLPESIYNFTIQKGSIFAGRSYIINEEGRAVYMPLRNHKSEVIGALSYWRNEGSPNLFAILFGGKEVPGFVFIFTGLLVFISFLTAFIISKKLTKPIEKMIESAMKVSMGDFEHGVEIKSFEEINKLAATFNVMVRYLRKQIIEREREIIKEMKKK